MQKNKEYINCPFCGHDDNKHYYSHNQWKVVKCKKCNHIYTNPIPKQNSIKNLYNKNYFETEERFNRGFKNVDYSNSFLKNIQEIENYFSKRGKLLEIGCAYGDFLYIMHKRGWDVTGIDISQTSIKDGKEKYNIDLKCTTIEKFETNEKYDVICLYQCLEHLTDPNYAIKKCFSLLKTNGILIIEVPNLNSFDAKISKKRFLWNLDLPYHLSHFTPKFLSKKLKENKFEIIKIDLYHPNFILKLASTLKNKKNILAGNHDSKNQNSSKIENELLMEKLNSSYKNKLINFISIFFPGWRFTIISKKK